MLIIAVMMAAERAPSRREALREAFGKQPDSASTTLNFTSGITSLHSLLCLMCLTSSMFATGGLGLLGLGLALSSAAPANAGWLNSDSLPEVSNVATLRPHAFLIHTLLCLYDITIIHAADSVYIPSHTCFFL